MMRKEFKVASSDGVSSYAVVFDWNGKDLHVTCDCKAGVLGQFCRHKGGLINGDRSLLCVEEDVTEILQWVEASPVGQALLRLRDAEAIVRAAQATLKFEKNALADLLNSK